MQVKRWALAALVAAVAVVAVPSASASVADAVATFTYTKNMHPLGYSARVVPLTGAGSGVVNSDLAFWGRTAYQGTYDGFRIVDIADPENPVEVTTFDDCVEGTTTGNQGDVIVWDDILVRSWNSATPAGGRLCGGFMTPAGQEGVHVFDVSDPANIRAVAFVATPCGSHTATGVPDLANGRLLVYNSSSSGATACRGVDILEVPLDNPAGARYLRFESSGDPTFAGGLENVVSVAPPSSAAGDYGATGAAFGPAPTASGVTAALALGSPVDACGPLVGFPAGAIAIVDRGSCDFVVKARNAQAAGAVGVIVANNVAGDPITLGGDGPDITIPAVMVSQANGAVIKSGLPATGTIRSNPTATRSCHDTGVILGDALRAACAGGNGLTAWSLGGSGGGSLEDPALQYSRAFPGVSIGHSAAFSWDGSTIVFGHEPGGGTQARCQATSSVTDRTLFFLDAATGDTVGTFVHPRPQEATENCTWHNYNVVPTDRRNILVSGNYQSGISVVDFTDPANAQEIGYADPAPLSSALVTGGDWSSYWYDGFIYVSDIRRGLIIWNLSDSAVAGARKLRHLNPQTQEFSFPARFRP